MRAPVLRLLLPLALLPALEGHASAPLPASGELTCESAALGRCDFRDPESGLEFAWPTVVDRIEAVYRAAAGRGTRAKRGSAAAHADTSAA